MKKLVAHPFLPIGEYVDDGTGIESMTMRDYFAAKALEGMFSADTLDWHCQEEKFDSRAQSCYLMADSMLKARAE